MSHIKFNHLSHSLWFSLASVLVTVHLLCGMQTQVKAQAAGWRSVSTGFSPQVFLNHNETMWAAGSAETIAVSNDAGNHWVKRYENRNGGLLLSLGFVNESFGYASGTMPYILMTQDGGTTWVQGASAPEAVLQAAFGDPQHGVIRTRSALLATTDAGKTWKLVTPNNDPEWMDKYPYTVSLTALDAAHLVVRVSEGEYGDGEFLWTADGGATWSANYLSSRTGSGDVFVAEGKYWSVGGEVVDKDKPGGGGNIPMALRSADGIIWEHLPVFHDACHWRGCSGCTAQGCFAGGKSFVPFSRILDSAETRSKSPSAPLAQFPEHLLSNQWARKDDTLCLLTQSVIECTALTSAAQLDTQDETMEWDHAGFPPLRDNTHGLLGSSSLESGLPQGVRCIRCNLSRVFFSKKANSGPLPMELQFQIDANGLVHNIKLSGNVPEDVASAIRGVATGWLFEPIAADGKRKTSDVSIRGGIIIMNPDKPAQGMMHP